MAWPGNRNDVAADLLRDALAAGGEGTSNAFSDLAPDAFAALARGMLLRRFDAGADVLREGDEGASLFVVAEGRLSVSRRDDRGERVLLARLGAGGVFGEMALLSGAPRAATVTAEAPSQLLELRADALREVAARHPDVAASLRRFQRRRVLANALALSPIFRPFGQDDRRRVAQRFHAVEAKVGDAIVREGEPSEGLYVVLDAAVEVVKRKLTTEVVVGQLRTGDLFGEMSCLAKSPATATARIRRAGTLLRLPREAFDDLVVTHPQILEQLAALAEERAESLDAILAGRAQWTDEGLVLV